MQKLFVFLISSLTDNQVGGSYQLQIRSFDLLVLTSELMNALQIITILGCNHQSCVGINETDKPLIFMELVVDCAITIQGTDS